MWDISLPLLFANTKSGFYHAGACDPRAALKCRCLLKNVLDAVYVYAYTDIYIGRNQIHDMDVLMHVYIYIFTCIYTYIYIYIYTCIHIYTCIMYRYQQLYLGVPISFFHPSRPGSECPTAAGAAARDLSRPDGRWHMLA